MEATDARDLHPDQQRVVHSDAVPHTTSTLKLKFLGFQVRFGPTPTQNRTGLGQSHSIAPVDPPKPRAPGFCMLECSR